MYPDNIRSIVKYQRSIGKSYLEISANLNISKSAVQCILNYKKVVHKKKSGPKFKINKCQSLQIRRYIVAKTNLDSK